MQKELKKPYLAATMLANVPYRDTQRALQVILDNFPEAPCMPVLTRSIRWMLEGIPCLVFDREKRRVYLDPPAEREQELLEFYDRCEQQDLDYFSISPKAAPDFYAMLKRLKEEPPSELKWIAYQGLGPVTLADIVKQRDGKSSFFDETLRDVLTKGIAKKSQWLEKKVKEELPDIEFIMGHAEANLIKFTSAGGSGTREGIIKAINEGFEGLNSLTWVHCCANIDWSLLTESNVDVINFDAYQHSDRIALYHNEFKAFLERGGMLGWGIVPVTNELIEKENVQSLLKKLDWGFNLLVSKGIDEKLLASSSWILPSCEAVMMTPELSDLALSMTKEISKAMKKRYGFE